MVFGLGSKDESSKKAKGGFALGRKRTPLVGLQASSYRLRFACLDAKQTDPYIFRLVERPLPPGLVVQGKINDRANFADELRVLVEEERLLRARTVLCANVQSASVFVKRFTVKRASQEEVRRGLPAHPNIKSQLTDPDNTVLQAALLDEEGASEYMPVLAIVAKKDAIEPRQAAGIESGLLIEAVDVDGLAIYNCFQYCMPKESAETALIVHIGDEGALIIVSDTWGPALMRPVPYGVEQLIEDIAKDQPSLTPESVRPLLWDGRTDPEKEFGTPFALWRRSLAGEVVKSVNSLKATAGGGKSAKPVAAYVCGEGAIFPGLQEAFETDLKELGIPVVIFNPTEHMSMDESVDLASPVLGTAYTLTLGLALRQMGG